MKIFCLYFGNKYSTDYVDKLYRGIKRHYSKTYEFVCYTDNPNVLADRLIYLPTETNIKKHWHKLQFFNSTFGNQILGEEIIVLDIDQVIMKDLSVIFDVEINSSELLTYPKWTHDFPCIRINGGFYKFISGSMDHIYQKYISDPEYWQLYYFNNKIVSLPYYGEQNFVQDTINESTKKIKYIDGKYVGFYIGYNKCHSNLRTNLQLNLRYIQKFNEPYMYLNGKWSDNIRIVHFSHILNNMHECTDDWLSQYWI